MTEPFTPYRYAVVLTGSRSWTWEELEGPVTKLVRSYPDGTLFFHGAWHEGFDRIAQRIILLEKQRRPLYEVPVPYFGHKGKAGGPVRDALLVEAVLPFGRFGYVMACEAFPKGEAKGTRRTMEFAEKAGIKPRVHMPGSRKAPVTDVA